MLNKSIGNKRSFENHTVKEDIECFDKPTEDIKICRNLTAQLENIECSEKSPEQVFGNP